MGTTETPAPAGILTSAADLLDAQGWTKDGDYEYRPYLPAEQCPVDLGTAIALAAGVDMHSDAVTSPTGGHANAVLLLARHVLGDGPHTASAARALDELTGWQDEDGRTAEQVIAAVRAAATGQGTGYPWDEDETGEDDGGDEKPEQPGLPIAVASYALAARTAAGPPADPAMTMPDLGAVEPLPPPEPAEPGPRHAKPPKPRRVDVTGAFKAITGRLAVDDLDGDDQ